MPDDIDERIVKFNSHSLSALVQKEETSLIDAIPFEGELMDYDEEEDKKRNKLDLLESWEVVNIDSKGIEI